MKILFRIFWVSILALLISCNKKVVTQSSTTETTPVEVEEVTFQLDSIQSKDTVSFVQYDSATNDSLTVKYVWNEAIKSATITADCPDHEEKTTTITETIDLSDESKRKIEDQEKKRANKAISKANKRVDKEIEKSRKQWVKDGRKEGRKQGRNQAIIGMAVLVGLYLVARFKFKLPI